LDGPLAAKKEKTMFHTILLCSDGSEQSLHAARAAAEIAQKFESQVILLHVYDPAVVPVPFVGLPESVMIAEGNMSCYVQELQANVERITGAILEGAQQRYKCLREIGHPVDRIVAVAKDTQADLIILGSRGLGGWSSYLLGSVSDGVLHHAHCPVLVVR
jgi:nucleotide-binding universal stress UspA family protein